MSGDSGEKNKVKARLLILTRMFYIQTDENNAMTTREIIDYLARHGAPANEKTLRGDIALLQELGVDIVKVVSRPNRYFWGDRRFELPELKLLIDAVASSRFITAKKSKELGTKLCSLASENQQRELKRHIYVTNRVKSDNETIYYMVDTINHAINEGRRIRFQYIEYTPELKPVLRNDGEVYELSPYALFWNEDYYYAVGWSDKHGNVSAFRVDRMRSPEMTEEPAAAKPKSFSLDDYSRRIFEMYDGEPVKVRLECRDSLAKYIVDRFGTGLKTRVLPGNRFVVDVEVSLSPTFYAWVFRFGGEIRILTPQKAVTHLAEMAQRMVEMSRREQDCDKE